MENNSLQHHGILGQKWGIRRFQKSDGTRTSAGKKREAKLKEKLAKEKQKAKNQQLKNKIKATKQAAKQKPEESKKKTIKDLSDDELKAKTNRLQMEKNYLDLNKQMAQLQPQKVSAGKKFVQEVGGKVIAPALMESGKNLLKDWVNKKGKEILGLNPEKDDLASLQKEYKTLNFKKLIRDLKKDLGDDVSEDARKKYKVKYKTSWDETASQAAQSAAGKAYVENALAVYNPGYANAETFRNYVKYYR